MQGPATLSSFIGSSGTAKGAITVPISGIAVTSTDGLILANNTAATAGIPVQQSPRLRFRSNVWNTTAVAANNTNDWFIESVPVSGTTPSGLLKFGSILNGAAATYPMTLASNGNVVILGGQTQGAGSGQQWAGRGQLSFSGAGLFTIDDLSSHGFGFNVLTDGVAKFQTRAQDGTYSTADARGYSIGGVVAISGTAPTIASGFGTGAAIANSNGTAAFTVNVGTTTANTGVITMPSAAHGWAAQCTNLTTQSTTVAYTKQTATSQTSITIGNFSDIAGAHAWADNDIISIVAMAY